MKVRIKTSATVKPLRTFMEHQIKAFNYARERTHPAFFMEMRLGKTIVVIRWVQSLNLDPFYRMNEATDSFPCLVVAPMSVLEAWEKELTLEGEKFIVVHGRSFDKRTEAVVNEAFGVKGRTWVLINYESLRATPGLASLPWWVAALDESIYIKNQTSKISKLCVSGFRETEHRTILSGLPTTESELELYQQFAFLHGSFMNAETVWQFRNKYFELKWDGWQVKPEWRKYMKDLVHSLAFVLTRKDANIGLKKIKENRYIEINPEQKRVYDKAENLFVSEITKAGSVRNLETDHVVVQRTWLARIAGGSDSTGNMKWPGKARELLNLLKGELANQPIVVWFRFDAEIRAVAAYLHKNGILLNTLTGIDTREERKRKQEWFRTSGIPGRVVLCQIKKVCEHGVDMSVSSTAIYFSVSYSCSEMAQTEERILHVMKKEPLLYLYLVTKETIDEDAVNAVRTKLRNSRLYMRKLEFNFNKRKGI